MVELSPSEQAYMVEMRMLSTDAHGGRVLVGLTEQESDFYIRFSRGRIEDGASVQSSADRDHYLELYDKHETARLQVLNAENELRIGGPIRN